MYVILKNGKRFAELATHAAACREARADAEQHRGNYYAVFDAETASLPNPSQDTKPLYQVDGTKTGIRYIIPNPPNHKSEAA